MYIYTHVTTTMASQNLILDIVIMQVGKSPDKARSTPHFATCTMASIIEKSLYRLSLWHGISITQWYELGASGGNKSWNNLLASGLVTSVIQLPQQHEFVTQLKADNGNRYKS